MVKNKPEVLAPAGDRERLEAALRFGADAVYLGGKLFNMRAGTRSFTQEELAEAVKLTHQMGKRLYLTCNTLLNNEEADLLPRYLAEVHEMGVDAAIVSDIGVLMAAHRAVPELELHISTQAGVTNRLTATELFRLGAKRVVLARELPLTEIEELCRRIPRELEVEVFVHGAMFAFAVPDRAGCQPGRLHPALPLEVRPDGGKAPRAVLPGGGGRPLQLYPKRQGPVPHRVPG